MKKDYVRSVLFWVVGILALVVIILLIISAYKKSALNQPANQSSPGVHAGLPEGYKVLPVEPGKYPTGFPQDTILLKNISLVGAQDVVDSAGTAQKGISFKTTGTPLDIFLLYQKQLPKLGWTITSQKEYINPLYLIFSKGSNTLEVVISEKTSAVSQVDITYKIPPIK